MFGGNMGKETRFLPFEDAELRLIEDEGKPVRLTGYLAKFGVMSRNLGGFFERIEKGFFESALERSDPVDLFNHDSNIVLGRKSAGTFKVWEDDTGLRFDCFPPDTQLVKDMVLSPIRRKDIIGNSFGFSVNGGGDMWEEDEDGRTIRTLKAGGCRELFDGSQVTFPAYPETELALRSMDEWRDSIRKTKKEEKKKKESELAKVGMLRKILSTKQKLMAIGEL